MKISKGKPLIKIGPDLPKKEALAEMARVISELDLTVIEQDLNRPWGASYMFAEGNLETFLKIFFNDFEFTGEEKKLRMSPKFLLVAPHNRLSWQYHHRRSEIWRVISDSVGVAKSPNDSETTPEFYKTDDLIILEKGERHRLVGAKSWGAIAEIWKHTDPSNPSNEGDIVRIQDDFGR